MLNGYTKVTTTVIRTHDHRILFKKPGFFRNGNLQDLRNITPRNIRRNRLKAKENGRQEIIPRAAAVLNQIGLCCLQI